METTIRLNLSVKNQLDQLKIHPRETYSDVIKRIVNGLNPRGVDRESLIETIEILSDPEAIRSIAEALEEINKGNKGIFWEEMKKELDLNV